jgi:hypothetical protein
MDSTLRVAVWSMSLVAAAACSDSPTGPPASLIGRFDLYWSAFDAEYSYFPYKRVDWDSLRAVHRPRAAIATTQSELVAVLKEMTEPLRDLHVRFITPDGVSEPTYQPVARANWDFGAWDRTARACGLRQAKPNLGYCTMSGVGYVVVGAWSRAQFSTADLDAVVDRFRDAPAIIIDVRMNPGGDDALAFALAGRFAAQSTVAGYVRFRDGSRHDQFGPEIVRRIGPRGAFQFTRPVTVLSGRDVYSSSESFIAAMRALPNVTILGDTTGGASGNPREHALGDGWRFTVSRWIETTADHEVIEWRGIAPDVHVPWDSAAATAGRDVIIEAALARLTSPLRAAESRRDGRRVAARAPSRAW